MAALPMLPALRVLIGLSTDTTPRSGVLDAVVVPLRECTGVGGIADSFDSFFMPRASSSSPSGDIAAVVVVFNAISLLLALLLALDVDTAIANGCGGLSDADDDEGALVEPFVTLDTVGGNMSRGGECVV